MNGPRYFGDGLPYLESDGFTGLLIAAEGCDGVGCSTQMGMLREWLELQGCGVVETRWTGRSDLADRIASFHGSRPLDPMTYALAHAADLAACLEKEILPALRNGLIVLANRYVYTAFARNVVRGADPTWVRDVFGFVRVPDLVMYFQLDANSLAQRVLSADRLGDEEAGVDLRLADDMFDSFRKYQTRLIKEFNKLAEEFEFQTIPARRSAEQVQEEVRQLTARLLERRDRDQAEAAEAQTQARPRETEESVAAHRGKPAQAAGAGTQNAPTEQTSSKQPSSKSGTAAPSTSGQSAAAKSSAAKSSAGQSAKKASAKGGKKIAVKSKS